MANFKELVAAFEGEEKPRLADPSSYKPEIDVIIKFLDSQGALQANIDGSLRREAERMVKVNYPEIYEANKGIRVTSDKMYIGLSPEVCRYMSMKLNEAGHAVVGDTFMHKLLDDVMGVGEDPVGEDGMDIDAPAWPPADVEAADEGVIRKGDPGDFYMKVTAKKFRGVWHYGVITGVVTEWVLEDYGGATQWRAVFEDGDIVDLLRSKEARVKAIMTEKELASPAMVRSVSRLAVLGHMYKSLQGAAWFVTRWGLQNVVTEEDGPERKAQRGAKARRPGQRGAKARQPGQRGAKARRPGQRGAKASGMGGAAVATE
eukprot:jgi/Tetstr1/461651/TSEL_006751.t1